MATPDDHSGPLTRLGVPEHQQPLLDQYLRLIADWNERTNLTAARNAEERVRILVADPWRASGHLRSGLLIDVGSGNGSPGLVLALLRPDIHAVLLEPRARRWAFLREAVRHLALGRVDVQRVRSDAYAGPPATSVTVRAVGIPVDDLEPLVEPSGEILVFGGTPSAGRRFEQVARHPLDGSELHVFHRRPSGGCFT